MSIFCIFGHGGLAHHNGTRPRLGVERNPGRRPDQVGVMYVIEPQRVAGQG